MDKVKKFEPLFGEWYVESFIGAGSFGRVYKIYRDELGHRFYAALKYISLPVESNDIMQLKADGMDEESISSYYHTLALDISSETTLMNSLKGNTNIVSFEDSRIMPKQNGVGYDVFIRMELLESLTTHLVDKPLSEQETIKLGADICNALMLCAKSGIIHRDIKPDNIFISPSGDYKLGDFGIARQFEKTAAFMSKKGTYNYMAPEVYKGEKYGISCDIYSLGMVMYKLLNNGRLPFMPPAPQPIKLNDNEEAISRRMRGDSIPAPVNASPRLAKIVQKACAYLPQDRYKYAEEMYIALTDLTLEKTIKQPYAEIGNDKKGTQYEVQSQDKNEPIEPETPPVVPTPPTPNVVGTQHNEDEEKKKRLVPFFIGAAAIALLVGLMAMLGVFSKKPNGERDAANSGVHTATATPAPAATATAKPADNVTYVPTQEPTQMPQQSKDPVSLSDDWKDFTFELSGNSYKLPVQYREFANNGFVFDTSSRNLGITDDEAMPAYSSRTIMLNNGETTFRAELINMSGNERKASDCDIGAIDIYAKDNLGLRIAKGINCFSTVEEVKAAFGEPNYISTSTDRVFLSYYIDELYSSMQIFLHTNQDDARFNSIHLKNIVGTDRDVTAVSEEYPEYLKTYAMPTNLGTDNKAPIVEIDGVLYRMPCPVSEFLNNGWFISTDYAGSVGSGNTEYIYIKKGNTKLLLTIYNYDSVSHYSKDCAACCITIKSNSLGDDGGKIRIPSGVSISSSEGEVAHAYHDFEVTDYGSYTRYTYEDSDGIVKIEYQFSTRYGNEYSVTNRSWDYK